METVSVGVNVVEDCCRQLLVLKAHLTFTASGFKDKICTSNDRNTFVHICGPDESTVSYQQMIRNLTGSVRETV